MDTCSLPPESRKPVKKRSRIRKPFACRWVLTGKIFTSSTTKVDSEPSNGSNEDITNQYECEQTLDVSACTINLSAVQASLINVKEVPTIDMTVTTSMTELESQWGKNQVVSKTFAINAADASNKGQQQLYSTSSTSSLATTVTANGNFD
ncbi:hypothetical protein Tco_0573327, partial [Tanacetum coccineum]